MFRVISLGLVLLYRYCPLTLENILASSYFITIFVIFFISVLYFVVEKLSSCVRNRVYLLTQNMPLPVSIA